MARCVQVTVFWQRIRQLQEEDLTVYVKVESANKGGLLVKYGPYEGFIPVSQFGPVRVQAWHVALCACMANVLTGHVTSLPLAANHR